MHKTNGSTTYEEDGLCYEKALFTYSAEEQEENQINRANAKLIFSPEFIPFYPKIQKDYDLTDTATKIYGFIRFFLANGQGNQFYFTDEQIGNICNCSPDTANRAISEMEKKGIIDKHIRIRANGGKIRYISRIDNFYKSEPTISTSPNRQKLQKNNNKINDNKIKRERVADATTSLKDFVNERKGDLLVKYPERTTQIDSEIEKFLSYWTEKNRSGKERWQCEKFFDVGRRLGTWFSNVGKWDNEFIKVEEKPLDTRELLKKMYG